MDKIRDSLNKKIDGYIRALERALKGMVVDLAANTPFDTGYHALNWQLSDEDNDETIGNYDIYHKRNFQEVLNRVSSKADEFKLDINGSSNISIFNNAEFITDLERGTPTAGTGPNANPGFIKAISNSFDERYEEAKGKL